MSKEEQIAMLEEIIEKQMEDIAIHREIEKRLIEAYKMYDETKFRD